MFVIIQYELYSDVISLWISMGTLGWTTECWRSQSLGVHRFITLMRIMQAEAQLKGLCLLLDTLDIFINYAAQIGISFGALQKCIHFAEQDRNQFLSLHHFLSKGGLEMSLI